MGRIVDQLYDIRVKAPRKTPKGKQCEAPGCKEVGEFKAPAAPDKLRQFRHFCLPHVRAYNKSWNFFATMSETEIATWQSGNSTWQRPTWSMGKKGGKAAPEPPKFSAAFAEAVFHDAFDLLDEGGGQKATRAETLTVPRRLSKTARKSLDTLGLDEDTTLQQITARYKELVKQLHPDTNGGRAGDADRLAAVIDAYRFLKTLNQF